MSFFEHQSDRVRIFLTPLAFVAAGCTFEPPGSVIGTEGSNGAEGGERAETLSVSFSTTTAEGEYAPKNVVATWVEDSAGVFVATLDRQSDVRTQHLVAWSAAAPDPMMMDAVSGATRPDHAAQISVNWTIPASVADGVYTVRMETAESNSVMAAQNAQATLTFEKNGTASTVIPPEMVVGYRNISVTYSGR